MSAYSSCASLNQERLGHFREKRDAYKSLISRIAERLSPDDLRSLFWLIDAPPKLRNGSALDVLENMEMAGQFSERNVQQLSHLLDKIKRIDLMNEVDDYSMHYGKKSPYSALQVGWQRFMSQAGAVVCKLPIV
jgi:hypothetical protein